MLEIQRAVFYSQIGAKSANGLAYKIPPIRPMIWPKLRVRAKSAIRVRMLSGAKKKRYKATYSFKFDGVVDLTT